MKPGKGRRTLKSGLEGNEPIPKSTVKALEKLARKVDRELPHAHKQLNLTDRLLLALPWLGGKLTYMEASQVIHWARILWDWNESEAKERELQFANIANFKESERIMGPVELDMKREKKRKQLVKELKQYRKSLRELQKEVDEIEALERLARV